MKNMGAQTMRFDTPPLSKSDLTIMLGVQLGYYADSAGKIYRKDGHEMSSGSVKRSGHLSVSLPDPSGSKKCQPVLAHRFIAYYFFGVDALLHQCVRHLNDEPSDNRVVNLAPGSFKQNRADICKEKLSKIGKKNAPRFIEQSRKLTDCQILEMRKLRDSTGLAYAKIGRLFGVAAMTAYRAITKKSWSSIG